MGGAAGFAMRGTDREGKEHALEVRSLDLDRASDSRVTVSH